MKNDLRELLMELKRKGLSKNDIIEYFVKKGVDKKKASAVTDAYFDEPESLSESFSDLIQDIKIQAVSEEELAEIRKSLKSDLYHGGSGLGMFVKSEAPPRESKPSPTNIASNIKPRKEASPPPSPSSPSPPSSELEKEALTEIQELKNKLLERSAEKEETDKRISKLEEEIKKIKEEMNGMKNLLKELITSIKEIKKML